jgi:hypothetical protein
MNIHSQERYALNKSEFRRGAAGSLLFAASQEINRRRLNDLRYVPMC